MTILNFFTTRTIICDNEKSLVSNTIKTLAKDHFGANIFITTPIHSTTNGQIERFHSTLTEIATFLRIDDPIADSLETILLATAKYNRTIHSTTKATPIDIVHSASEDLRKSVHLRLSDKQKSDLTYHNRNRTYKTFDPDETVFENL